MVYSSNSETFHRNNPSILTDQLYLAAYCALSHARLHELGITCIINATLELPTMASQKHDAMQIAVEDRVASKLYVYFDLVADKIHSVHNSGGKVMIYCRAGMSRSASLCIAYFMRHKGMNLEEAFDYVKNCRPIIHPNVGFMRQLREYEAKVLARNSRQKLNIVTNPTAAGVKRKHSTAMGRGPLVIGEPLPDILYAEEQVCDEIDVPILEDIPKRPKPRILKPKPWMPDRLMESYQIHTVQVLGDSKLDTIEEPSMAMNKTLINRTQTPNKGRKRHLSKQKNATVGISKEVLGVALSRCDTPLIDVCPTDQDKSQLKEPNGIIPSTHQPTAPPRRKPFTKVNMESTKIPVSSLTVPMGMCAEFKKGQRLGDLFSREKAITLSSFMTGCKGEGVLVTATEHHELILECCSDSIISDISIQPVIASSNLTSDARSCNTNNSSQIDLTSSRNISNKNISRHSLCSSSNSRHSYSSQRHQPYPSNITSSRFKITSSSACDNEFSSLNERARCMICPPLTGVATVCIPQVYECSGIYRRQNLPGNLTDTASISHFKEPPPLPSVSNVPSRFSSMSSSQSSSAFSRAAASRKSIKLSEGLKISPMPTKFNKRSEIILPKSNEYFSVAIAYCQPIILERTQELKTLKRLSNLHSNIKAKMKLYAPSLGVAEITENIFQTGRVYENVSPNVNSDFNVAHLLTYPRRTAILSSGYVTVYDNIPGVYPSSNEESVFHTIPSKEYPYYSPHHVSYSSSSAAMNKLQRATIEPTVESSWFFESSIRPHIAKIIDQQTKKKSEVDQGVVTVKIQKPAEKEKVNTTASASVKIRLLKEPEVRWAAERCEYQPDFLCTKPIPDLIKPDKAKWNIVTRAMNLSRGDDSNNKDKRPLRYDQYSTLDHTEYQMVGLGDLKHIPKRPESYYAWYIMQMCAYPLYQSATCSENPIYENTNMYCEPTPFKDYAKVTKHSNMGNVKGSYDKGFCVAVVETSDVVNNLEELIDIPSDMVGGIAEMKKLCQNKYVNESTMEIWIGVIKASILRSRPMYPLVSIEEPLCIANICDVSTLILEDPLIFDTNASKSLPFPNLPSKYPSLMMPSVLRARAMPLTVQRQPINNLKELNQALLFPLEVTECVCVDAFHTTTGPLKNNNINAKKEKCSESRTYIRDYTISYWSEPIEEFMVLDLVNILEDVIPFTAIRTVEPKMPRITAITNYNILFGEVQGNPSSSMPVGMKLLTKGGSSNSSASNLLQLQRKPFSIVSGLRPVVEICHKNILHAESTLPVYDVSNQSKQHATSVTQSETKSEWLSSVTAPVDTFWYFKLDTPKTKKKDTPLAEIEPVEELDLVKRPETPLPILGKAKSYQLFLPDPDMIDRLADTFVSEEEAKHADGDTSVPSNGINSDIETVITEPEITTSVSDEVEIKDLVQGSVKERKSKGERRVMIADPPAMIVNEESPSSIRKRLGSFGKLISYQRPRNESPNKYLRPRPRSRSKSRKREEKRRREEEDRQAISDLQNSVQNASYLLDRRRTVGKSTYYGMGSSSSYPTNDSDISISAPERNRGRARERLSTNDAITYSNNEDHKRFSNSSMLSSNSQDLQPNGSAIRGLLGVAQDWLFNHTSRSERSIDRSKSLLRKSKL